MPQRFLRPGITNSQLWNRVSWKAQSFYIRIVTLVDDYGRFDGRHSVLCSQCFTIWNELHPDDMVTLADMPALCQELQFPDAKHTDKCLCDFYEAEGKKVVQVTQWRERLREGASKRWPDKAAAIRSNPQQSAAESCGAQRSAAYPVPVPVPVHLTPSPSPSTRASVLELVSKTVEKIKARTPENFIARLQAALGEEYQRPETHVWSYAELSGLAEIARRSTALDEWQTLLAYKRRLPSNEKRFFPNSVARLLSCWDETLDRARISRPTPLKSRPPARLSGKPFVPSPELGRQFREAVNAVTNKPLQEKAT